MGALRLSQSFKGTILRVHCRPGRAKSAIVGVHDGGLRIDLKAPPEQGKANDELLRFLARLLGLPREHFALTSGQSSRSKSVLIAHESAPILLARLADGLPSS